MIRLAVRTLLLGRKSGRASALASVALLAGLLSSCETTQEASRPVPTSSAPGLGSAVGGLLGSLPAPSSELVLIRIEGPLLEGVYRDYLSYSDLERAQRAAVVALEASPSGQARTWRNPENGHWGTMTPSRTYLDAEGRYCREYQKTVTLGGLEYQDGGTACRLPEGAWRIAS